MRYSLEPKYRKYVQGYGFWSFARNFEIISKLMDSATKTGINAAKTASKRVVQKTEEATGDLIGNKMADQITSVGKPKNKKKERKDEKNEGEEIYIPPEKRHQIINDFKIVLNTI